MPQKPENGKFSLGYWLLGQDKKDWLRPTGDDFRRIIIYVVIFCIGFTLYTAFWPKKPQGNVNKPNSDNTLIMTPGTKITGNVTQTMEVTTEQKTEQAKHLWWIPHLYTSFSAGAQIKSSKNSLDFGSAEPEVRADILGLRWDWN